MNDATQDTTPPITRRGRDRRTRTGRAVAALTALMMAGAATLPSPAWAVSNRARVVAGATAAMGDERDSGIEGMSEAELQGAGCIASGTAGTIAAYATDANEVVMIVAGGLLAPSTPAVLGIVMLATVFTSGCAVGAIATPFLHWAWRQTRTPEVEDDSATVPPTSDAPEAVPDTPESGGVVAPGTRPTS